MRYLSIFFSLFLYSCSQSENMECSMAVWVRNAIELEHIRVVPSTKAYAGVDELNLRGLTLEQVCSLYGRLDSSYAHTYGLSFPDRESAEDMGDLDLSMFKDSDFPITIISPTWERDNVVLQVDFVKYMDKWVVFNANQYPKELLFLE